MIQLNRFFISRSQFFTKNKSHPSPSCKETQNHNLRIDASIYIWTHFLFLENIPCLFIFLVLNKQGGSFLAEVDMLI
jgi:hypothetical protein